MTVKVRRVVTGHDNSGRAIVSIDEVTKNVQSARPGASASVIWTTEGFPVDNSGNEDTSGRKVGTTLAGGTIFRIVEFGPGVAGRNHRTDSIDYAVIISARSTWISTAPTCTSRPATCWCSAARSTTGSTGHCAVRHRLHPDRRQAGDGRRQDAARCRLKWPRWNRSGPASDRGTRGNGRVSGRFEAAECPWPISASVSIPDRRRCRRDRCPAGFARGKVASTRSGHAHTP